ncbi:MAG TPA: hypothetical protein ENJ08_03570 [Gammaproteobacteria bacterium]|nr:hypothetical protein [Gammaproteobacteria bacterium]
MSAGFNAQAIKKSGITLFLVIFIFLPHNNWLDNVAENYTEQGIERTLITYAVSRSLNGVISVVQGTEIAVSPVGVGVTFTPGQILDPVNDLIERFSQIVLISSTSLGIQRLFLEIASARAVSGLVSVFCVVILLRLYFLKKNNEQDQSFLPVVKKILIILLFFRFSISLVAIINEGLYLAFLQPQYEQSQVLLEQASDDIQLINNTAYGKSDASDDEQGMLDKVERWLDKTQQGLDFEKQIGALKQTVADISQQVINMIVVFVVQSIIFPLLFLWLAYRAGRKLLVSF